MADDLAPAGPNGPGAAGALRLMPVRLIEMDDGIIVKRGRAEVKFAGARAKEVVSALFTALAERVATPEEVREHFDAHDRPAVTLILEQLESRRMLVPADSPGPATPHDEDVLDVFYWHFGEQGREVAERLGRLRVRNPRCEPRVAPVSLAR